MTTQFLKTEIKRFLASKDPEVLCIDGHWGVGKTYAWNSYLREAQAEGTIALPRYAYVSLFGINSLEEFKYAIFENGIDSNSIGVEPSLDSFRSHTAALSKSIGKKSLSLIKNLPVFTKYVGDIGPAWFLTVKDTLICIDDIERKGDKLDLRNVLGLVSALKERKKCKIALILNDDALGSSSEDFRRYFEKVIDIKLHFAPGAQDAVDIALPKASVEGRQIADNCVALGISNIRVIKKIERSVAQVKPLLATFDEDVLKQAIQSLVLLGWMVYEPDAAPSLDYLRKKSEQHAEQIHIKAVKSRLSTVFRNAWDLFHDSFKDNQNEVVDAISKAFYECLPNLSLMDVNGTVTVFRGLGLENQAQTMLKDYVTENADYLSSIDFKTYPFSDRIDDPDVQTALAKACSARSAKRNALAVLKLMAGKNSWHKDDTDFLSTVDVEEYYQIFKTHEGPELKDLINACLQFDRIGGIGAAEQSVASKAKQALRLLASESPINAIRMLKFGIRPENASKS